VSNLSDRSTPRREFIGQLTASAIVLASAACATPVVAGQSTTVPGPTPAPRNNTPPVPVHWDDSWFSRLTAKHKAVFDSPAIEDGLAVSQASGYVRGMRDAAGAGMDDVQTVLVMRHAGIPMVFNDAMWEKYEIGKEEKVKDYSTKKWATRNPFSAPPPPKGDAPARPAPTNARPQGTLSWLGSNGHILLGCDLATRGFAGQIAERTKGQMQTIYEELKANLVPGVILQPTGVYAVHRAQEAGCSYIRST
jgi:hypothetical protein